MIRRFIKRGILCLALITGGLLGIDYFFPVNLSRLHDQSRYIYNENGTLLYAVRSPKEDLWRLPVSLDEVDQNFIKNLIKIEDKRFYFHPGVDPLAIGRSIFQLVTSGRVKSGASTITMQTIRLLERRPRTLQSKLIECFRALQLEYHFSKDKVLEMYLTLAPYGGNIEGVKAASYAYFNHAPDYLSPAQAALLIALPKSPEAFRPDKHPISATRARGAVLAKLGLESSEPVPMARHPIPRLIPHLGRRVIQAGAQKTFIDLSLQQNIETIIDQDAVHNTAVLVVDHQTHKVVAYVGADDFFNSPKKGQVDFISAIRSPGSTLKPFIYGLAMDMGILGRESILKDQLSRYAAYAPHNFDRTLAGDISVEVALKSSLNTPVVKTLGHVGANYFWDNLQQCGMMLKLGCAPNLSIALGGFGTNLESLVMLYGSLANSGVVHPIHLSDTLSIGEKFPLLSKETAASLRQILLENHPFYRSLGISYKTGTSYGHRDAWAIGLNYRYTVGVWIGHAEGTPMRGTTGRSHGVPILRQIFNILPNPAPDIVESKPSQFLLKKNLQQQHVDQEFNEKLKITFPVAGSIIESTEIQIPLKLENSKGSVIWFINNKPSKDQWFPKESGFYNISAIDARGEQDSITVSVKRKT